MANTTKLDPIIQGILIDAVKTGVPYTHACELAGIAYQTFRNWQELGEEGKSPYMEFLEALKRARGEAVEARIKRIEAAGKQGSWQADAWWLERQIPSEFGKREAVELTGKDGGAVQVNWWQGIEAVAIECIAEEGADSGEDAGTGE